MVRKRSVLGGLVGVLLAAKLLTGCAPALASESVNYNPNDIPIEAKVSEEIKKGYYESALFFLNKYSDSIDDCDQHNLLGNWNYFQAEDCTSVGNEEDAKAFYLDAAKSFLRTRECGDFYEELGTMEKANLLYFVARSCNGAEEHYDTALEALDDLADLGLGWEDSYEFFMERGDAYFGLGEYEDSMKAYAKALGHNPTSDKALEGYEKALDHVYEGPMK